MNIDMIKYEFDKQLIDFEVRNGQVMVNATQMAKIFGKDVPDFMILKNTKDFISECLKNQNSGFLAVEKEEDLVLSKQKSGTYMHRILALKFAAWLDPKFELWVFSTIDEILFGNYKKIEQSLKESAERKDRIDKLRDELREDEKFRKLEQLQLEEKQAVYSRVKENRNQLDLFRNNLLGT